MASKSGQCIIRYGYSSRYVGGYGCHRLDTSGHPGRQSYRIDLEGCLVTQLGEGCIGSRNGQPSRTTTYVHFVNPKQTKWSETLCPPLATAMSNAKVVSLDRWVKRPETRLQSDTEMQRSSAASLLDFYKALSERQKSLPTFETIGSCQWCPALHNSRSIQPAWLLSWKQAWILPL